MNPERQAFKNIEDWLVDRDPATIEKLIGDAVEAFYEDHPEVRFLYFTPEDRLEVNFFGEHPAYKYFAEELTDEHSKLKKCLEIFENLIKQTGHAPTL